MQQFSEKQYPKYYKWSGYNHLNSAILVEYAPGHYFAVDKTIGKVHVVEDVAYAYHAAIHRCKQITKERAAKKLKKCIAIEDLVQIMTKSYCASSLRACSMISSRLIR